MAGDPPASSNVWGYRAFQRALEDAKSSGIVRSDLDVEVFLHGFLAAWDLMADAVEQGGTWPPADW